MLDQGGVKINGEKISDTNIKVENDMVIQVGKRKFSKIRIK
jgi:tyrosyl-tRNA synthetase